MTYTFIALPGLLLGFSALQSLVTGLTARCCVGKTHEKLQAVANLFVLLIQVFFSAGLFFAASFNNIWREEAPESVTQMYGSSIKAMSYASAIFVIGVKMLGVFCHGPQAKHLVLRTTDAETRYEAALQLALVATIFLSSGTWTTRSLFCALSSILVIGKVGVESFFKELEQERNLSKASLLGKICIASSVLPVFVLTALFRIGSMAIANAWDNGESSPASILLAAALLPPALAIFLVKTCLRIEDLSVAGISQGVVAELVSLHLWPCGQTGRRIGLGVTVFKVLLYSFMLAWIINNPEAGTVDKVRSSFEDAGVPLMTETLFFEEWARVTATRFQIASICCLVIGWITLPLVIGQVFCQDIFTKKLADNCLDAQEEEEEEEEEEGIKMKVEKGELNAILQENESLNGTNQQTKM